MYDKAVKSLANGVSMSVESLRRETMDIIKADFPEVTKYRAPDYVANKGSPEPKKKNKMYVSMFMAEFLGTGMLMFLGCMGCIVQDDKTPGFLGALAFGLTVMLIIQMFGHVSGAHLNPAVTIAALLFGDISPAMALLYVIAQFTGATLGFGLLKILVSDVYDGFCTTNLKHNVSILQGIGIEIVITTVLILVCYAVWDPRNASKSDSVPLRFGFVITAISIASGPYTGASMNTARSFAPVIWGGSWHNHWIYWIGPNVAPFIAFGLYKLLFSPPVPLKESSCEQIYLEEVAQKS